MERPKPPILWIINRNWSISQNWMPIGLDKPKLQEQELGQWILCRAVMGFYHNNGLKGEILDIYGIYYYRNLFMLT
jgi:hypothetical protein